MNDIDQSAEQKENSEKTQSSHTKSTIPTPPQEYRSDIEPDRTSHKPRLPSHVLLRLEELFGQDGILQIKYGMTRRKSQTQMHQTIFEAFSQHKGALIEAPTGTGKTFGYLFPSCELLLYKQSISRNAKVVISTASKSLQDQLLLKDFPFLKEIYPTIKTAVWKGASNYLCLNRLEQVAARSSAVGQEARQLKHDHKEALDYMINGTREELPIFISDDLWSQICGGSPCCSSKDECKCYKRQAYLNASESDLLCMNHTLLAFLTLYADMLHPSRSKPEDTYLIVDEAHEMLLQLQGALNRNFSLHALQSHINKVTTPDIRFDLQSSFDDIFSKLFKAFPEEAIEVRPDCASLVNPLMDLSMLIFKVASALQNDLKILLKDDSLFVDEREKQEAKSVVTSLFAHGAHLGEFLTSFPADEMLEVSKDTRKKFKKSQLRINFFPFTYENELNHIYSFTSCPPILTSATLFNAGKTQLLRKYCLPDSEVITRQIIAEFDYLNSIKGFCFPNLENPSDPALLAYWLRNIIPLTHGNALVLFTNTSVMNETFDTVRTWGISKGYNMLKQGQEGDSIGSLIGTMKKSSNSVLFGVSSLWTGNDIKGSNLSNLIITKLPFRAQDNFANCFSRYLENKGQHPFRDWVLPEMINTFRQGLGRLKRDETDKGLLFILDPRFVTGMYKNQVVAKLPMIGWEQVNTPSDLPDQHKIAEWLGVKPPKLLVDSSQEFLDI